MNTKSRFAVVVSVSEFDDESLNALPCTKSDGDAIRVFLEDEGRGGIPEGNLTRLHNPSAQEVRTALAEAARRAGGVPYGLLFVYVASHGVIAADGSLQLLVKDTDVAVKSATAVSSSFLIETILEHRPSASIAVFDVCHASAHTEGLGKLSLHERWAKDPVLGEIDGHFVLAACSTNQTAKEGVVSGRFTTAMLEGIEKLGKANPRVRELPAQMVCTAVLEECKRQKLSQTPRWSGLGVASAVSFCGNPDYDPSAPGGHPPVSIGALDESKRGPLRPVVSLLYSATAAIGSGDSWSTTAHRAVERLLDTSLPGDPDAIGFAGRAVDSIFDAALAQAAESEMPEVFAFADVAGMAFGRLGGLQSPEFLALCYRLTALSGRVLETAQERFVADKDEWFAGWGPAAAAIAPIYLLDRLGEIALTWLGARVLAQAEVAKKCETAACEVLASNRGFFRLVWIGQLPDVCATVAMVAQRDPALATAAIENMLAYRLGVGRDGILPLCEFGDGETLGRSAALHFMGHDAERGPFGDESIPVLFMAAKSVGMSDVKANGLMGEISFEVPYGDALLYVPRAEAALYQSCMRDVEVRSWPMQSIEQASKLVTDAHRVLDTAGTALGGLRVHLASLCSARLYRNRSAYWVLGGRTATEVGGLLAPKLSVRQERGERKSGEPVVD